MTIYWLPSNGAITQCSHKAHAIKVGRTSRVQQPIPFLVAKRSGSDADSPDSHDQVAPIDLVEGMRIVTTLGDISIAILQLPTSTGSLQGLKKCGVIAIASGGTTDLWWGSWNHQQVALKAFRIYRHQDLREAKKILWKLVPIWKRLVHKNVLPFYGIDTSIFQLALLYN